VDGVRTSPVAAGERNIAADPTSVALLLAAPSSAQLWPGAAMDQSASIERPRLLLRLPADLGGGLVPVAVRTAPPSRTPTTFVWRFEFLAEGCPRGRGELTLGYVAGEPGGTPTTAAALRLTVDDPGEREFADVADEVDAFRRVLASGVEEFLDNLAAEAEGRSHAA
jgi:hypothetical protein